MSKALILVYHRVAEVRSDPWALCVTPQHFAEQLEVLRERARVIPLQRLLTELQGGELPPRSVVVTFDDGYADNLHSAKPLLERAGAPATVFVATGCLEPRKEFWWDTLEAVLLSPGRLPERLGLRIAGELHQWELGEEADYSEDSARKHRAWRAWQDAPTARHSLYLGVWQRMQPLQEAERGDALEAFLAWAGSRSARQPGPAMLSPEDVVTLARGGVVDVGAHTVSHPVLAALPPDLQREEIRRSKATLEGILGRPVTGFAYPYGSRSNYTDETADLVREAGFHCACSTLASPVGPDSDPFQLPRLQPEDWDGEEFGRRLDAWLG